MNRPGRTGAAMLIAATLALATACDGDPASGGSALDDPATTRTFDELMKKPTIDEAVQHYTKMQDRIIHALSAAIPALAKWQQVEKGGNAGCLNDEAETRDLGLQGVYQNIPEEEWETAVSIVGRIAAEYGFESEPLVLRDKPGEHDVTFHNVNDDSSISIGTHVNTSLSVDVGCHLTAEAKQRGRPKPPPTY